MIHARVLLVLALILFPAHSWARVVEATLYPNLAQVKEEGRLVPSTSDGLIRVRLQLPASADPGSLAVQPLEARIGVQDVRWDKAATLDTPEIASAREAVRKQEAEVNQLRGRERGFATAAEFWAAQGGNRHQAKDLRTLSSQIQESVAALEQGKLDLAPRIAEAEARLKTLRDKLSAVQQRGGAWNVDILIASTGSSDASAAVPVAAGEGLDFTWSYTLNGSGWSPAYRVEALPAKGLVQVLVEAEVYQGSGSDWTQANILLATTRPGTQIAPPEIPAWSIRPVEVRPMLKGGAPQNAPQMEMLARAPAQAPMAAAPAVEHMATFDLWTLGPKAIPAGSKQRFRLKEESWPAKFLYLLRPSQTPAAFLQAEIERPETDQLPSGQAVYMIEGAVVGKRDLSLTPGQNKVAFGQDPQIGVRVVPLAAKSGKAGFTGSTQTYEWAWRFEVKNGKGHPVRVRLEEPVPMPGDERIKLTLESSPKPVTTEDNLYVWEADVPKTGMTIEHRIKLEAPKDLPLDLGWRK